MIKFSRALMVYLVFACPIISGCASALSKVPQGRGQVRIVADGVRSGDGYVTYLVTAESNRDDVFSRKTASVVCRVAASLGDRGSPFEIAFPDLEYGNYIVVGFHDANANGEMDFSLPRSDWLFFLPRWPIEGIAVSNLKRPIFGRPSFETGAFAHRQTETIQTVSMGYSHIWYVWAGFAIIAMLQRVI